MQATAVAVLAATVHAEDQQPLFAPSVHGHEHVGSRELLHSSQLAPAVASYPALAIRRNVDLRDVVAVLDVSDRDGATALLQQPLHKLAATSPLRQVAGDEGDMADVLEDGARGQLQLFPRSTFLAQCIAHLLVSHDEPVRVKAPPPGDLLPQAPREEAWAFRLDAAHDLQLGPSSRLVRAENHEPLRATPALAPFVVLAHEEHEAAPLFLHGAQSSTASSRDVADAIAGHVHASAVVAILPVFHVDRALQLLEKPLHVFPGSFPLLPGAREKGIVPDILHHSSGGLLEFPPGTTLLAQGVRELVVLERHGVGAPGLGLVLAFVATQHILPDLLEVARDLRLHGTEHEQLCATSAPDTAEDCELLVVLVPATASADVAKKHQGAPLLLDGAQEVARAAGHEAHGLLGNLQHCKVAVVVVAGDRDGPRALGHDALGVLLGLPPLELGAPDLEDQVALEELDLGLGHPRDLLLGLAALAKDECSVVVRDFHCVHAIVVGLFVFPVATAWAPAPAPAFLAAAAAALAALAAAAAASRAAHGLGGALRNLPSLVGLSDP
mmetsp:Transcript_55642/g.150010  ORF Transcript_55642/g.150010 Transcript_55642/m.150010 type:complete len:555 (-) Transcript_55642:30-1694(-)